MNRAGRKLVSLLQCNIARDIVDVQFVLNTAVIVAAIRSDGGISRQLVLAALDGRFELLLSAPLPLEHEGVLKET